MFEFSNIAVPELLLIIYFLAMNIYGFAAMGIDKWKSSRKKWRIPERTLLTAALLGGSAGVYLGMKAFHHKTLHNKFRYGVPIIFIINIIITAGVLYSIKK